MTLRRKVSSTVEIFARRRQRKATPPHQDEELEMDDELNIDRAAEICHIYLGRKITASPPFIYMV